MNLQPDTATNAALNPQSPLVMPQDATSFLEPSAAPPDLVWSHLASDARKSRATRAAPPPEPAAGFPNGSPLVSKTSKPLATRSVPPPEPAAVAEQGRAKRSVADEQMGLRPLHERQRPDLTRVGDGNNEVSSQVYIAKSYTIEASPRRQGVSPTLSPHRAPLTLSPRHPHFGTRVLAGSAVSGAAGAIGSPGMQQSDAAAQESQEGLAPAGGSPSSGPSIHARIAVACSPRCTCACMHDVHDKAATNDKGVCDRGQAQKGHGTIEPLMPPSPGNVEPLIRLSDARLYTTTGQCRAPCVLFQFSLQRRPGAHYVCVIQGTGWCRLMFARNVVVSDDSEDERGEGWRRRAV